MTINQQAIKKLSKYSWPGNIREFQHTIEKAVILSETDILKANDFILDNELVRNYTNETPKTLDEIEKQAIIKALSNNQGNIKETSLELGIARQTLYNKMQKYNL